MKNMKKTLSLFLAIISVLSLICVPVQAAEIADLETYALSGYGYHQIPNGWANITIQDTTDANGVITSTATHSGTLDAGKRVATFQPWVGSQNVGTKASEHYTMHLGYTVKELTSPLKLKFTYKSNNTSKEIISFSDSKVVSGSSMDGNVYINVTLPYTIDIFMNTEDLKGYVYVNGQLLYNGQMTGRTDTTWSEAQILSLEQSTNIRCVTTAATGALYHNSKVSMADVIDTYLGRSENERVKALESYVHSKEQLNNNWGSGVTLTDVTDVNGAITTFDTASGTVAANTQVGTFDPWEDYGALGSNATEYTMHFGFTVNEISDPVYLQNRYRNGTFNSLITLSDNKVVAGDKLDGTTFVEVTLPYTVNIFMNTKTCDAYIYVNDQCVFTGDVNYSGATQWRQVVVKTSAEYTDFRLVTSNASNTMYKNAVTTEEVVAAYMNKAESTPVADETGNVLFSGIKNMSDYAVDGYDNKQLNNGWTDSKVVNRNETTDVNGVITSTVYQTGSVASNQRAATFYPIADKYPMGDNAGGHHTLHFGFTVNELTSPVKLGARYYTNSSYSSQSEKYFLAFSNNKVVMADNMSGSTYVNVTAPYRIDIVLNMKTLMGNIYVNGKLLGFSWLTGANKMWFKELRVLTLENSSNFRFVTTAASSSVYNENVLLQNVDDYVMNRQAGAKTNWLWKVDGMNLGSGMDWMQGAVDGLCNITGNNEDGYVLQPTSINANHYGFARFFLGYNNKGNDDTDLPVTDVDNVLWQTLEYNPTVLTSKHYFRIRGNNGYQTLMSATPATETESAYLSVGGNKIPISSDKFYKLDFIVNHKTDDYEYYILVDGKAVEHAVIAEGRRPLWNLVYAMDTVDEKMTIKNLETTRFDSTVTIDDVVDAIRVRLAAPFATDSNGYGDFEVENYDCYNADSWTISEALKFSGGKALAVKQENRNEPGATEDPTLNLSFKANKAGENTYYMWVRHTASVANQSGQNCFLSLTEDGSYSRFKFTAEQNAPQWICLGSITANQGETGFVRVRERQQNHIAFDRYVITTDASFVPTDAYYQISPGASSTAYKAPAFVDGRTSFEAEHTTYTSPYETYSSWSHSSTYGSSSNYSNSSGIVVSSSDSKTFDKSGETAGQIEFNFTPTTDGSKYLWARIRSTSTNKDIAISVNCSDYVQFSPTKADEHYWQLIYVIDGAQANLPINVRMYNVSGGYAIDKFAVTESVFDTPNGKDGWTAVSSTLPSTYSPSVTQSQVTALSHPRIYFTSSEVASLKDALSKSENAEAYSAHGANVSRGKADNFTGKLAVVPGAANYSASFLGVIESLALEYALKGYEDVGQKAVSSVMNYVSTVSYANVDSETLPRVAGNDIAVLSRIYDWCYDLFTAEQRTKFIDRCIEIAYQFELGWPPANLSAITGYGAEGSLQNYLLTFAIAVADERPDIYNYVVGRIENEFVPARKIMYASGTSLQGTRYGTFRGQHDLTAALLLNTIGYDKNIYGDGLKDLVNWYIYLRRPDGLLFLDGDDTNNGKSAGSYYSVGHMQSAFVIAARLFNDPYIKNEAKKATSNFTTFNYEEGYLSPSEFLAINRPSLGTTEVNGYSLSKFFGTPNGTLIARTGWTNSPSVTDNTAVAYMKTGEANTGNHQHLDAGNFQLYYKGILANDPGHYDSYNSEYMNMYAKRSVAHNTVLVRDNVSQSLNGHSIADGGQVAIVSPGKVSEIQTVAKTEAYDFGGDDVNQPDYSYLKADLTGAYRSSSVGDYNRSFMFLNMYDEESPAALVVFDRLSTKNSSHKTAWLLHGMDMPTVSGSRATFSLNENGYTGKMTNDTLLPANPSITTVEDGRVTATGTKFSSSWDASAEGVNESDGYRIEVSPKSQTTLTYYLNVVQLSDAGADVVTPTLIENDTFAGALLKDRVVLFSKSGDLIGANTSTEYAFNFAETNGYVCKIAVADVTEGTWEVSYSEDGSDYKVMTTVSTSRMGEDKGATISFAGRGGYYKLKRVSAEYTQKAAEISTTNEIKQLSPSVKLADNKLQVAPRTYTSMSGVSAGAFSYTHVIAVYKEHEDGIKELLSMKILNGFNETDKYGEYSEIINLDELPEGVVVKTFLLKDLESLDPVTDFGIVKYY